MITHITTKNFMGLDIDEDIGPKMIYTGENTAGKTKRSKAITLTLLGFVPSPGKTIKIANDILNTLGDGKEMSTAITCGGEVFERIFKRGKTGTVSQKFKRNGKTRTKAAFMVELVKAGDPRIVDLDQFLVYSDNAKIDDLFELYPPDGDLSTIDSDIEKSKKEISRLNELKGESDNVITALVKSKGDIELPAGSLAETREAIKKLTQDILDAQKSLKDIETSEAIADAIIKEKADAKAEAERIAALDVVKDREKTQTALDKTMEDNTEPWTPSEPVGGAPSNDVEKQELRNNFSSNQNPYIAKTPGNQRIHDFTNGKDNDDSINVINEHLQPKGEISYPAVSIQKIIDTMKDAGCKLCAAGMVAKMELRKYEVVEK